MHRISLYSFGLSLGFQSFFPQSKLQFRIESVLIRKIPISNLFVSNVFVDIQALTARVARVPRRHVAEDTWKASEGRLTDQEAAKEIEVIALENNVSFRWRMMGAALPPGSMNSLRNNKGPTISASWHVVQEHCSRKQTRVHG